MRSVVCFVVFLFCLTSGPVADARPAGRTEKVDWSQYLETKSDRPLVKSSAKASKASKAKKVSKAKAKPKKRSAARAKKRR